MEQEETGLPSFVVQGKTDGCACYSTCELFAKAELGIPIGKIHDLTWKNPQELFSFLQNSANKSGGKITIRKVGECLQELVSRPQPGPATVSLLIHPQGHLYLLIGTVMIGDVLTFQLVHGDSAVWLVSMKELEQAGFQEAWKFSQTKNFVPIQMGKFVLGVDKIYHNFWEVKPQQEMRCKFVLENKGNREMILKTPATSCSCAVPSIKEDTKLKPGEQKELEIVLQPDVSVSIRQMIRIRYIEETGLLQEFPLEVFGSQRQSMEIILPNVNKQTFSKVLR
jgi:hypothetical protein